MARAQAIPRDAATAAAAQTIGEDLIKALRGRAAAAEEERNVPAASIAALREAGAFRTLQSRRFGGAEASIRAHIDMISSIGRGCGSTAWVGGVYHAHTWMIAHFPEEAQHDVHGADANLLISAVIAPRGRAVRTPAGDYKLDGVWPFCSGVRGADWVILGAVVFDEAGKQLDEGEFLIPKADVEVMNDWRTAGLAATGSHTIKVKGVSIPSHRFLSLPRLISGDTDVGGLHDSALYKCPAVPVLTIALTGSSHGIARAALDDYVSTVAGKAVAYSPFIADDWSVRLCSLGGAASRVDAAELLLYRCADAIDSAGAAGGAMSVKDRARARMDCAQAVRFCMEAVDAVWTAAGGGSIALSHPLQRAARDLHAINQHGLLALDVNADLYGRVLSGKEPNTPLI